MGFLAIRVVEVLAVWSGIALILSVSLAAVMRHGRRLGNQVARVELRKALRYALALPVLIHSPTEKDFAMRNGRTRNISARGVYFLTDGDLKSGNEVNLTITVPDEIAGGTDVYINVTGKVVRVKDSVENDDERIGVAVAFDHYEIVQCDVANLRDKSVVLPAKTGHLN